MDHRELGTLLLSGHGQELRRSATIENDGLEEMCVTFQVLRFGEEKAAQVVLIMPDGTEKIAFYAGGRHGVNLPPGMSVSIPMQPKSSYAV